jgi:hypothetical protein
MGIFKLHTMKRFFYLALAWLLGAAVSAQADAVWQWSAPVGAGRAFLWVPPHCRQVRAVVVGQNNMIEEGILQHEVFRKEMAKLGIAEIFIAPQFETWQNTTNNDAANAAFDALLRTLAAESGYAELAQAPIVPLGHSAMATFPWNFAAWNPGRTLAILSVHGDAPQTKLTGNGRPNADWGGRSIDGIPGLMVMGEYEWWEDRLTPLLKFQAEHPAVPLAVLGEPGRGHFDYSDDLVKFLALFIRKAAEARLPETISVGQAPILKPVDPHQGWRMQRWHLNQLRTVRPARFDKYTGDPADANWAFDRATAWAIQDYRGQQTGRQPQLLGFVQDGHIVGQVDAHQQVNLKFEPETDGLTFRLAATFLDTVDGGSKRCAQWTGLPAGSSLGHATGGGPVTISRITGPVEALGNNTFRVVQNRATINDDRRVRDIWLLAEHPGDGQYKSIVQQALLRLPTFTTGPAQQITFPKIADQKAGVKSLPLVATSNSGRPVQFFVREGPAVVEGDRLRFCELPKRAKFPLKVTVVAWQWGSHSPDWQTAAPVAQTFLLQP